MPSTISLNGSTYGGGGTYKGFSNIEEDIETFGDEMIALDGTLTQLQTGQKRRWTITWDKVPAATRNAVRTLATVSGGFVFVDQDGTSYTVQCPFSGRFRGGIGINGADNTKLYYGVTLQIWQV